MEAQSTQIMCPRSAPKSLFLTAVYSASKNYEVITFLVLNTLISTNV